MADRKIDYDRGIMKRSHPMGLDIYMYLDTPGVYLTAHETPVSEEFAKQAGFEVALLAKDKLKRERMAAAKEAIERELEVQETVRDVVKEVKGFKVVSIGLGRHMVEDPDGNTLNKEPLALEQAEALLAALTLEASKAKA